jgi:sporulation protein YabP
MEKENAAEAHGFTLAGRKDLSVTGVKKVESFDDQEVILSTTAGALTIRGENLHIRHLDLQEGRLVLDGLVSQVSYAEASMARRGRVWQRLIR